MKKLALTSLFVLSLAASSYAANLTGVTDSHFRTEHYDDGSTKTKMVGAKHLSSDNDDKTPTLFLAELGASVGGFLDKAGAAAKAAAKAAGGVIKDTAKSAVAALNTKLNSSATPAQVQSAATAPSPVVGTSEVSSEG